MKLKKLKFLYEPGFFDSRMVGNISLIFDTKSIKYLKKYRDGYNPELDVFMLDENLNPKKEVLSWERSISEEQFNRLSYIYLDSFDKGLRLEALDSENTYITEYYDNGKTKKRVVCCKFEDNALNELVDYIKTLVDEEYLLPSMKKEEYDYEE